MKVGNAIARKCGNGAEPITLSTATLSGIGVSRSRGAPSKSSTKINMICVQKGLVCCSRRR